MSHLFDLAAIVAARLVVPLLFVTSTLLIVEYVTDPPPVTEIWEALPSQPSQSISQPLSPLSSGTAEPTATPSPTLALSPEPTATTTDAESPSTPTVVPSLSLPLPTSMPLPTLSASPLPTLPLPSPSCFLPPACGKPEKLPCLPIPLPLCP